MRWYKIQFHELYRIHYNYTWQIYKLPPMSHMKFQFGSTFAGLNGCLVMYALFSSYKIHTFKKLTELKCAHKELNQCTSLHKNQPVRAGRRTCFSCSWLNVGFHIQYCHLIVQKSWLSLPHKNSSLAHKNLATHLVIQAIWISWRFEKNKHNPNCIKLW